MSGKHLPWTCEWEVRRASSSRVFTEHWTLFSCHAFIASHSRVSTMFLYVYPLCFPDHRDGNKMRGHDHHATVTPLIGDSLHLNLFRLTPHPFKGFPGLGTSQPMVGLPCWLLCLYSWMSRVLGLGGRRTGGCDKGWRGQSLPRACRILMPHPWGASWGFANIRQKWSQLRGTDGMSLWGYRSGMGGWGVCVGGWTWVNVCSLAGLETKGCKPFSLYASLMCSRQDWFIEIFFLFYSDFHIYRTLLKLESVISSPVPKII